MSEQEHWADGVAKIVKQRCENDPVLKKIVEKQGYLVYDEKTPSGTIHIGSGRGWLIHDAIAKAMRSNGMDAKFVLSADDIDPYDKPSTELGSEWNKYLGMPFRNMPSPVEGYKSYADYYFMQCVEKFEEFGIEAEIESTGEQYEKGVFNRYIKIALDNADKIQDIFKRLYGEDVAIAQRLPFNPICENCGRIATTSAIKWDKEKELLYYECKEGVVKWADGCGHKGWISPYDGNGKFPWKVEWAAKWPAKGVVCELAGKDHFTKNGSRTAAMMICNEVFDFPPPYPSDRKKTGKGYEFFNIGGKKMSTSKGLGVGFSEIAEKVPPLILRYLLIKSRPHTVLDFDPYSSNGLILLYDSYDRCERIYFGEKGKNEHEESQQKRIYELARVGDIPSKMPVQVSLTLAAITLQVGLDEEGAINILKKLGHIPEDLSGSDRHSVMQRLHDARLWLDNFATDNYIFQVQDKVNIKLEGKEKEAFNKVALKLREKSWKEEELHTEFYNIVKGLEIEPKDFFKSAYQILINKEQGPKLASFVLTLGEKAIELFEQV